MRAPILLQQSVALLQFQETRPALQLMHNSFKRLWHLLHVGIFYVWNFSNWPWDSNAKGLQLQDILNTIFFNSNAEPSNFLA
jgi:hypothetical protein